MSVADFIRKGEELGKFELIDGALLPMSPHKHGHDWLSTLLGKLLDRQIDQQGWGVTFVEATFILPDTVDKDWVTGSRVPDVMVYFETRWHDYADANPDWFDRPLALIPDLVVEVISPNDAYSATMQKAERYLADGVRVVWLVDAATRTVATRAAETNTLTVLREGDTLTLDPLPGFALPIADLFARLKKA